MSRKSVSARKRSGDTLLPLPVEPHIWARVVNELKLSPQLAETAALLLRGMQCKAIASQLGLAEPTVRTYLNRIYKRGQECGAAGHDHTHFILLVFSMSVGMLTESNVCHSPR